MLMAGGYLLLTLLFGDALGRHWFRYESWLHRLATAVLIGLLLVSWATLLTAWLLDGLGLGLLAADAAVAAVLLPITAWLYRRPSANTEHLPSLARRDQRWDLLVVLLIAALVGWMMLSTYGYEDGTLRIAVGVWSDFGPTSSIAQSFGVARNIPTEYPHFANEPIQYHFLFYFAVGNLVRLGLDPALANNLLSITTMLAMLMLVMALGRRLFGSAVAGRIGAALFFVHGSLSFIPFLASYGSIERALAELPDLQAFISSGFPYRGEDWGLWSQMVFLNQRHLVSGIGLLLVIVLFLLDRLGQRSDTGVREANLRQRARLALPGAPAAVVSGLRDPNLYRFMACGLLAGLLPLWNGAAFIAAGAVLFCWLVLLPNRPQMIVLGVVAALVALPQLVVLRVATLTGEQGYSLFHLSFTIEDATPLAVAAYIGFIFGPKLLLAAAALSRATSLQVRVFIAVSSLTVVAFTLQLSVEVLANHKFLNIWLVVVNVFAAYGLVRLWQARGRLRLASRPVAAVLVVLIATGGILEFLPIKNQQMLEFQMEGNSLYEWVRDETAPEAVFLSDIYGLHPILLAGRRLYYGWPYYSWSAGYDLATRDASYRRLLAGRSPREVVRELQAQGIDYVAFDDGLRTGTFVERPNETLFAEHLELVYRAPAGEQGNIAIYRVPTEPDAWQALPDAGPVDMWTGGEGDGAGELRQPRGIAVGADGAVYVADSGNHRLQHFAADGSFAAIIGDPGSAAGQFNEPNGLAVDADGRLFIADTGNHRLAQLDGAGQPIDEWRGPEPGFYGPRDVALGEDGMVWVLDQGRARVAGRAADGTVITFGSLGDGPAELNDPTGLAVAGGLVYVADPANRRIQVFTTTGDFLRSLAVPEWGTPFDYPDVAVDIERGLLYASQPAAGEVLVFDLDGERLTALRAADGQELRAPSALAVAPDGRLLVVDYGAARVVALEPPAGLR